MASWVQAGGEQTMVLSLDLDVKRFIWGCDVSGFCCLFWGRAVGGSREWCDADEKE